MILSIDTASVLIGIALTLIIIIFSFFVALLFSRQVLKHQKQILPLIANLTKKDALRHVEAFKQQVTPKPTLKKPNTKSTLVSKKKTLAKENAIPDSSYPSWQLRPIEGGLDNVPISDIKEGREKPTLFNDKEIDDELFRRKQGVLISTDLTGGAISLDTVQDINSIRHTKWYKKQSKAAYQRLWYKKKREYKSFDQIAAEL